MMEPASSEANTCIKVLLHSIILIQNKIYYENVSTLFCVHFPDAAAFLIIFILVQLVRFCVDPAFFFCIFKNSLPVGNRL